MANELQFRITADAGQARIEMARLRELVARETNQIRRDTSNLGSTANLNLAPLASEFSFLRSRGVAEIGLLNRAIEGIGKDGRAVVKETVESLSSEIIEGFGIDGDIANVFGKQITGLPPQVIAVGAALTAAAIAVGVFEAAAIAATLETAKLAKELDNLSRQTGLSTETIQRFKALSKLTDIKVDVPLDAFTKFRELLAETGKEGAETRAQLRSLGVDAQAAATNPEAAFQKLLGAVASNKTGATEVALAYKLAGDAGRDLVRIAEQNAREAAEFGQTLTREQVTALAAVEEQTRRAGIEFDRLKAIVAGEVAPALQVALQDALLFIKQFEPEIRTAGKVAREILIITTAAIETAVERASALYNLLVGVATLDGKHLARGLEQAFGPTIENRIIALKALADAQARINAETANQSPTLPGLKPTKPEDQADRRAAEQEKIYRERLRALENQLRDEEALYRRQGETLKRQFDERLISEEDFTKRQQANAQRRFDQQQAIFAREEQQARRLLSGADLNDALADILRRRTQTNEAFLAERERIEFDSNNRLRRAAEQLQQALLQTEQARASAQLAIIRDSVQQQVLSHEEGERRIAAIQLAGVDRQIEIARRAITDAGANLEQRRIAEERLSALQIERQAQEQDGQRAVSQGRARDIEERRRAAAELRRIQEDTARAQIDRLGTFAGSTNERVRIAAIAETNRQIIEAERRALAEQLQAELDKNAASLADDQATAAQKLANREELAARLKAIEERAQAEIEAINRRETVDTEEATPGSLRNVAGDAAADNLDEAGARLQGFAGIVAGAKATIIGELNEMAGATNAPFQSMGGVLAKAGAGFLQTGLAAALMSRNVKGALSGLAATVLKEISSIAFAQSAKNFAFGLEALGLVTLLGSPAHAQSAGHFFAASALWAGLGAGAALGAGALSGGGAAGAAGQSSPAANQLQEQQKARELAVARGNPFDKDGRGINETVFDASNGQLAVIQRVGEAINKLENKLASMTPGDVVTVGASDARSAIASATLEHSRTDDGFNSQFGRNLLGVT